MRILTVGVGLLVLCSLGAEPQKNIKSVPKSDSPVLVRVNGQPVTEADLVFLRRR